MTEKAEVLIRGKDETAQAWASVQRNASDAIGRINDLIPGLAAGLTAAGLVAFAKNALDAGEQLNKMSQRTGITVEELSKLKYAASQSDVDIEKLALGIKKLSTNAFEAGDPASQAAGTFKLLGINAADASGKIKPTGDLLLEVAERFAKMEDGAGKSALAVRLFGKAGDELIPFLNQGRSGIAALTQEAEKLGIVMTKEGAEAAEKFNDSVKAVEAAGKKLSVAFVNDLAPAVAQVAEEMRKAAVQGGSLYAIMVGFANIGKITLFGTDDTAIQRQTKYVAELQKEIKRLEETIPIQEKAGILGRLSGGDPEKMKRELAGIRLELQWAAAALERMKAAPPPELPKKTGAPKLEGKEAKPEVDEIQKYIDKQNEAAQQLADNYVRTKALLGDVTEEAKVRYDTEFGKLAIIDDALKANLITRAKELDQANAQIAAENARQAAALKGYEQAAQEEIAAAERGAKIMQEREKEDAAEAKRKQDKLIQVLDGLRSERAIEDQDWIEKRQILEERAKSEYADRAYWQSKIVQLDKQHSANVIAIENQKKSKLQLLVDQAGKGELESMAMVAGLGVTLMQAKSRKLFEIGKVFALAQATINTAHAITSALAVQPFPVGLALAAVAAAAGAVQIQAINAQQFNGGGSAAGTVGTFSANPSTGVPDNSGVAPFQQVTPAPAQPTPAPLILNLNAQFIGSGRYTQQEIIDGLGPALNEAIGDGFKLNVTTSR